MNMWEILKLVVLKFAVPAVVYLAGFIVVLAGVGFIGSLCYAVIYAFYAEYGIVGAVVPIAFLIIGSVGFFSEI